MDPQYHRQITAQALENMLSARAIETIVQANLHQDDFIYLLGGYPHYHFDDSEFERTYTYLDEQRDQILNTLSQGQDPVPAWEAFGRITHTLQDFYAHSNYVHLWMEKNGGGASAKVENPPNPDHIDPQIPELISSPRLFTTRVVLGLEILNLIPVIGRLLRPYFPSDIHASMNLDNPTTGPLFPYAIVAARKRTQQEFAALTRKIQASLSAKILKKFTDL